LKRILSEFQLDRMSTLMGFRHLLEANQLPQAILKRIQGIAEDAEF
jgi:hypothetical protein